MTHFLPDILHAGNARVNVLSITVFANIKTSEIKISLLITHKLLNRESIFSTRFEYFILIMMKNA